jgi:hypothetical protein
MKVGHMEVPKVIDNSHNVFTNDIPTMFVEDTRIPIWTMGLVTRKKVNGVFDFILREKVIKRIQI